MKTDTVETPKAAPAGLELALTEERALTAALKAKIDAGRAAILADKPQHAADLLTY